MRASGPGAVAPTAAVQTELLAALARSSPRPNPARARAVLGFDVPERGPVRLSVCHVLGREVAVPVDALMEAGQHAATFDGSSLPAGTYLVRLETEGTVETRRVTLVR